MFNRKKEQTLYLIIFLCFNSFLNIQAQDSSSMPVEVLLHQTTIEKNIATHVLKVTNNSDKVINGTVNAQLPEGITSISSTQKNYIIPPSNSSFILYKLLIGNNTRAGDKIITYTLDDDVRNIIDSLSTVISIIEREQINILADMNPVVITNMEDSVNINVIVNNTGNNDEVVSLVFNVPNLRNTPVFTEVTDSVMAMESKQFSFRFLPSSNLAVTDMFQVVITAMKGKNKSIFDSKNITVKNIVSGRNYVERNMFTSNNFSSDNSLSVSYRQYNSNYNMLQIKGGGYINMTDGYMHLKGNVYKQSSSSLPQITNTSLTYKLNNNSFTVGNISESLELPLYGRGIKAEFGEGDYNNSFAIGAVDHNYNLISPNPMFRDYYSFFAKAHISGDSKSENLRVSYLYQQNPYEKAKISITGLEWKKNIGEKWMLEFKTYAAIGDYDVMDHNVLNGSFEARYNGTIGNGFNLNGSGYYSNPYFPGSRRGAVSVNQSVNKRLWNNYFLSASYSYYKMEPKSYAFSYNYLSENNSGSVSLSLPKVLSIYPSIQYHYQDETSNSYSTNISDGKKKNNRMSANRAGVNLRWLSWNTKHSIQGSAEGGLTDNFDGDKKRAQAKYSFNYAFKGFTFSTSYQDGAFYVFEQVKAQQNNWKFNRLTGGISFQTNLGRRFTINNGVYFSDDTWQGENITVNGAMSYNPGDNWSVFANGYWNRFNFMNTVRSNSNFEVGITYNFKNTKPSSKRKSKMLALIYYDNNFNNKFDEDDKVATNYLVSINDKAFITNKNGEVKYNYIPHGKYSISPISSGRWYFKTTPVTVDGGKTIVNIPLKQNGVLEGNINYTVEKSSLKTPLRYSGIRFIISNKDNVTVQTAITDSKGNFKTFLPEGEYTLELDKNTLMENSDCKEFSRKIKIEAGNSVTSEVFEVKIQGRVINIKRFT